MDTIRKISTGALSDAFQAKITLTKLVKHSVNPYILHFCTFLV